MLPVEGWRSEAEEGWVIPPAEEESSCTLLHGPLEDDDREASDWERITMEPFILGPSHMVTAHTHKHTVSTDTSDGT